MKINATAVVTVNLRRLRIPVCEPLRGPGVLLSIPILSVQHACIGRVDITPQSITGSLVKRSHWR